jgi:hypothetical protein
MEYSSSSQVRSCWLGSRNPRLATPATNKGWEKEGKSRVFFIVSWVVIVPKR